MTIGMETLFDMFSAMLDDDTRHPDPDNMQPDNPFANRGFKYNANRVFYAVYKMDHGAKIYEADKKIEFENLAKDDPDAQSRPCYNAMTAWEDAARVACATHTIQQHFEQLHVDLVGHPFNVDEYQSRFANYGNGTPKKVTKKSHTARIKKLRELAAA